MARDLCWLFAICLGVVSYIFHLFQPNGFGVWTKKMCNATRKAKQHNKGKDYGNSDVQLGTYHRISGSPQMRTMFCVMLLSSVYAASNLEMKQNITAASDISETEYRSKGVSQVLNVASITQVSDFDALKKGCEDCDGKLCEFQLASGSKFNFKSTISISPSRHSAGTTVKLIGSGDTVLDGGSTHGFGGGVQMISMDCLEVFCATLELRTLTMQNGMSDGVGGAVAMSGSTLNVANVMFSGNRASGFGFCSGDPDSCECGGAIYAGVLAPLAPLPTITIANSTFSGNMAGVPDSRGIPYFGGAVYVTRSTAQFANTVFSGNFILGETPTAGKGVDIYADSSDVVFVALGCIAGQCGRSIPLSGCCTLPDSPPSCVSCTAGKYQSQVSQTNCLGCITGQYQDQTAQSKCQSCISGHYQDRKAQTNCTGCPCGWYQSQVGQTNCTGCDAGQYQDQTAQSKCPGCIAGHYQNQRTQTECTGCVAGQYQDQISYTSCKHCKTGQVARKSGTILCSSCPKGQFSSDACNACIPSSYLPITSFTLNLTFAAAAVIPNDNDFNGNARTVMRSAVESNLTALWNFIIQDYNKHPIHAVAIQGYSQQLRKMYLSVVVEKGSVDVTLNTLKSATHTASVPPTLFSIIAQVLNADTSNGLFDVSAGDLYADVSCPHCFVCAQVPLQTNFSTFYGLIDSFDSKCGHNKDPPHGYCAWINGHNMCLCVSGFSDAYCTSTPAIVPSPSPSSKPRCIYVIAALLSVALFIMSLYGVRRIMIERLRRHHAAPHALLDRWDQYTAKFLCAPKPITEMAKTTYCKLDDSRHGSA